MPEAKCTQFENKNVENYFVNRNGALAFSTKTLTLTTLCIATLSTKGSFATLMIVTLGITSHSA